MHASTATPAPDEESAPTPSRGRRLATGLQRQLRAPIVASAMALLGAWAALTPSMLPRSSPLQGVVVAVAAWAGYGLGALLGWAVRRSGGRLVGDLRRNCWRALAGGGALGSVLMLWWYYEWENELRDLVGMDHQGAGAIVVTLLVALVLFVLLIAISRAVKAGFAWIARGVGRFVPAPVATLIGVALTAFVGYTLLVDVATSRILSSLDAAAVAVNDEFRADRPAPENPYVSAGPGSQVEWDKLGRQGRVFISNRPSAEEITRFSQRPAVEPVRAYVGIGTDGDIDLREQAVLAADELERLGGFDREVVNVVTGTGRGWVNEDQAQALEYMWNGDTATVSMQYSYLPSPISFLVDRSRAKDAGRLLFDAVFGKWLALPEESRPKLVVSGESLGSFGGEAAFSGEQDMANRIDGALFVGPTNANELWSRFTEERDAGSTEMAPVYGKGEIVRFAGDPTDWEAPSADWTGTRVGYLQHANDPITWWNWSLALHRPDWLEEPTAPGVSPDMRWIPFVTMLQLGADQMMANEVPAGQGHRFGKEPVWAWAAILPPPGWTADDTAALAAAEPREGD
ncbi:alpha/beta hydrolase [Nocardioides dubius]|uniref:Alpha/beta-hydrolase family protein n=2 Tax=Nocardioides dubius TaxID=317019 RepID=A0ABN1TW60_9ACTN